MQISKMLSSFVLVMIYYFCICDAKPMLQSDADSSRAAVASFGRLGVDNFIVGGKDAERGAWPWQLSQQRLGSSWSHSCGASLLSATKALSAAHCVDGTSASIMRVVAGLHDRTVMTDTQISNVDMYVMHERYQVDSASYSNDIAILYLQTEIVETANVKFLTLPPNNIDFVGFTCSITGWGRTSSSQNLPNVLQEASIGVITVAGCALRMQSISGIEVWNKHICVYDDAQQIGSCNGDSGGPLNCPTGGDAGYYVAGVTSWGISNALGNCLQTYPSVYTRTSEYLDWIAVN